MKPALFACLALLATPALAQDLPPPREEPNCVLTVKGKEMARGACTQETIDTDGSFTVTWKEGGLFVYVLLDAPLWGNGYWNGTPEAQRAHDPLGVLRADNACWLNDTASVCFF